MITNLRMELFEALPGTRSTACPPASAAAGTAGTPAPAAGTARSTAAGPPPASAAGTAAPGRTRSGTRTPRTRQRRTGAGSPG